MQIHSDMQEHMQIRDTQMLSTLNPIVLSSDSYAISKSSEIS